MKKILTLLLLVAFTIAAQAQDSPAPTAERPHKTAEQRGEEITQRMTKELKLTEEQIKKIKPVATEIGKELVEIDALRQTDRLAFREKRKTIIDRGNEKLLPLLTPEQAERYKLLQQGGAKKE